MIKFVKLISLLSLMFICVLSLFVTSKPKAVADTTPEEEISALLSSYIDSNGQYTKLTSLETSNIKGAYHANANTAKRRTYYDENVDALLMGDYDGTFTYINSGYAKEDGANNMQHYRNSDDKKDLDKLFTSRDVDYNVMNTKPTEYFYVLSDLATKVSQSSGWTKSDYGLYTLKASEVLSGSNDELLKMFQYFAAPMVLVDAANNFQNVQVYESNNKVLVIRLLNSSEELLSTAYVVKGLTKEEIKPDEVFVKLTINYDTKNNGYLCLAGTFNSWTVGADGWKLDWTEGNNWTGWFRFTIGTNYEFKFVVDRDSDVWEPGGTNRFATFELDDFEFVTSWKNIWSVQGSFNSWSSDYEMANDLKNDLYVVEIDVAETGYPQFKVRKDWSWNEAYPSENAWFHAEVAGTYLITFNPSTHEISVSLK